MGQLLKMCLYITCQSKFIYFNIRRILFKNFCRSQAWFKGSLNSRADKAYPPVTLESIKEADDKLKMKKEKLKEELKNMQEHIDSLDFEQKAKLLSQTVTDDIANLDKSLIV